jgi:hypothetical protein
LRRIEIPRRAALCLAATLIFFGYVIDRTILSPEEYLARKDLYMVLGALTVYLLVALNLTASALRVRLVIILLILASAHVAVGRFNSQKVMTPWCFHFCRGSTTAGARAGSSDIRITSRRSSK